MYPTHVFVVIELSRWNYLGKKNSYIQPIFYSMQRGSKLDVPHSRDGFGDMLRRIWFTRAYFYIQHAFYSMQPVILNRIKKKTRYSKLDALHPRGGISNLSRLIRFTRLFFHTTGYLLNATRYS